MFYLISQLLMLLAIASLLSGAIGWLCRRFITDKTHAEEIRGHQRAGRRQVAEIDDLRRELTDRNSQVANLNAKLHENRRSIDETEEEKDRLHHDLDQLRGLEKDYEAVTAELARIDQERADVEGALHQAQNSEADTAAALLDAQKTIANRDSALHQSQKSAADKESALRAAASTAANLEDIISSLNADIKEKDAAANRATKKQAALAAEIAQLEQRLRDNEKASSTTIAGLEKSLRNEKDTHSTARQAVASAEEKLKGLEALLAERNRERDKLEQNVANQQSEIGALQQEISRLQKDAADAKATSQKVVADLERALDAQTARANSSEKETAAELRNKDHLQNELGNLQRELKSALQSGEKRQAAIADSLEQQKLAVLGANNAKSALESKLQDLKRDHDALKATAGDTANKLQNSDREAARLAEKIAAAEKQIAALESQLAKLSADAEANEKRLQRELAGKDASANDKDRELRESAEQVLALQDSMSALETNNDELRAMIVNLQTLLSEERRLAGQNLLSRIKELEAMLEAERRKAAELREIPQVSDITWRSKSLARGTAANSADTKQKKSGT